MKEEEKRIERNLWDLSRVIIPNFDGKFWPHLFGLVLSHCTPDRKYFYICIIYGCSSFQWYLNDSSIPAKYKQKLTS
jgi:hypothetical protein